MQGLHSSNDARSALHNRKLYDQNRTSEKDTIRYDNPKTYHRDTGCQKPYSRQEMYAVGIKDLHHTAYCKYIMSINGLGIHENACALMAVNTGTASHSFITAFKPSTSPNPLANLLKESLAMISVWIVSMRNVKVTRALIGHPSCGKAM